MDAFLLAFAVIFVAELGDKSQLMALAFSTRFRPWPVVVAITGATALTHLFSVALGSVVGDNIPTRWVSLIAGIAFLGFAAWTWRGDELDPDDEEAAVGAARPTVWRSILAIGGVFFLAELGDKTMLATVTLATKGAVVATWLGSTLGMVAADGLAIFVGRRLGTRLPERTVRIGATVAFVVFGVILIAEAARG